MRRLLTTLALVAAAPLAGAESLAERHPGSDALIERAVSEYELDRSEVEALLAGASFQQQIADLMARPAEGKPWHEYRPIFITEQRLSEGLEFWQANATLIEEASTRYGVDPQVIVAIIGIETYYGRITGDHRVLDALTTLAFHYPSERTRDRSDFFSRELLEYMVLGPEEGLPLTEVTGSYAGAMGMGQFMPSSYRAYAVDGDGDGRRDLWQSTSDAVGSVANYLHVHGWEPGGPVMRPATIAIDADTSLLERRTYKPEQTVLELHEKGFQAGADLAPERGAALVKLDEVDGDAHYMTFKNFYVITRYNRSPLYATVVYQLSEQLREAMERS